MTDSPISKLSGLVGVVAAVFGRAPDRRLEFREGGHPDVVAERNRGRLEIVGRRQHRHGYLEPHLWCSRSGRRGHRAALADPDIDSETNSDRRAGSGEKRRGRPPTEAGHDER